MHQILVAVFYFLVFSIPFGTRKLVWQFTEGFSEYAGIFIYGTDILMLGALFLFVILTKVRIQNINVMDSSLRWNDSKILFIFLIFSATSIFFAYSKGLAIYNFSRLLILVIFALVTADLLKKQILKIDYIFAVLAASGVFQAIVARAQFIRQGSVGLYFLGEPRLDILGGGIAKITVEGVKVLRAYGTLPHPNILAAFLLLGLFGLYYLWLQRSRDPSGALRMTAMVTGLAIVILGLILTFSRAAWLVGGFASVLFLGHLILKKETRRAGLKLFFISGLLLAIFIFALYPYIVARAPIVKNEPSVTRRLEYNKLALDIIKNKPLGVGVGNQVIYSAREGIYQKFGMDKVWMWEPVHNLYLLIATEIGISGLLFFIIFIYSLFYYDYNDNYDVRRNNRVIVIVILSSVLLLGLFDHYFWTIQQGRLMWWLIIGIIMGVSVHSSTDRMHPSEG